MRKKWQVVCIYQSEEVFKKTLLSSIIDSKKISTTFSNNSQNIFPSASFAYNRVFAYAEYLVFAHQDIFFADPEWFTKAEKILDGVEFGVVGSAGVRWDGSRVGNMMYGWWKYPLPQKDLEEVATLDEQLLIVRREVFEKVKFDEKTFDGWHLYGADYCLQVKKKLGLPSYVINLPVIHNTSRGNVKGFLKYAERLLQKYPEYEPIPTTCGTISRKWIKYRKRIEKIEPAYRKIFPGVEEFIESKREGSLLVLSYNRYLKYSITPPLEHFPLFVPAFGMKFEKREFNPQRKWRTILVHHLLEFLEREEAERILEKIEKCAKKILVIEKNREWIRELLTERKYMLHPLGGWKALRGPEGEGRFSPRMVSRILGDAIVKWLPFPGIAFLTGGEREI